VILNSHRDIVVPPEGGFAMWLYPKYKGKNFSNVDNILAYLDDLYATRKFETWTLERSRLRKYLLSRKLETYADIVNSVYVFYGKVRNRKFKRWGDKNNFYLNHIFWIDQLFPHAQFIHIIRDGRDVACSYIALHDKPIKSKYKPNLPCNIINIAHEWVDNVEKIETSFKEIDEERRVIVRYEDLVLDFRKTMRGLLDYLHLPYGDSIETYYIDGTDEPREFLQWKSRITAPPDRSRVGRYKHELDKAVIEQFNRIASVTLRKYNYEL
jgi:hypothetical protein